MNPTIDHSTCPNCGGLIPAEASQGVCPKCLLASVALPTEAGASSEHRPEPPSVQEIQAALPQLQILDLIGCGGMGAVYRARQPKLDRLVALKVLLAPLAADAAFAARFNREACLLARLNHPGVVSVFDYGEAGGFFYLVMEYVDGVNLRQAMQAGRFTPVQTLALVPKICEALQYAHDEGILHRDIKPENILLDLRGRVKIADFGIAKLAGENARGPGLTASGAAVGTPHYMAPEQLEHPQDVDLRADLYSLGVVFYEMLAGELPIGRFAPPSHKSGVDPAHRRGGPACAGKGARTPAAQRHRDQAAGRNHFFHRPARLPSPPGPRRACHTENLHVLHQHPGVSAHVSRAVPLHLPRQGRAAPGTATTLSFHSGWQIVTIPPAGDCPAGSGRVSRLRQARPAPLPVRHLRRARRGAHVVLHPGPPVGAGARLDDQQSRGRMGSRPSNKPCAPPLAGRCPWTARTPSPAWGVAEIAKTYVLTAAGCTAAYAVIPILLHHRAAQPFE